jgi:predicted phage terminase large subunit-like protein
MNVNNVDISKLPADVRKQFRQLQVMHAERKIQNKAKNDFLSFVKCVWPEFVEGAHHRHIAKKFNDLAEGKINRLIVNMPPRHTKSEFASFLLPAWMVGRNPKLKIIQATHTGELAIRFGRKAKTLIDSPEYSKIFETRLREDSQAAGRWETAQGGEYFAAGVGGAITGRGADLLIIDDPHSEQEYWKLDELEKVKATLPVGKWNAQWMQQPTSEEGAIIKREWWRTWKHDWIPDLHHVIQSYDTAFMKKETADYSAITTWGVFYPDEDSPANLILLDSIKQRYEFPELRRVALDQYKYWTPETVIIEAKASGLPLTYELRQMDIPVSTFTPSKGNDKHVRVNTCAPLFESGMIWAPDQQFAEEVIEECAAFPHGDHDDLVDSMTMAVMRFRQGGFIQHPEDYVEEKSVPRKKVYY